jgi:hypothetical protein
MTISLTSARFREASGRDGLERASLWQGNAGTAFGLNCAYSAAGCATATTTSKAKIVNTTAYTVGGRILSKGATDNFWTLGGAGSATTVAVGSWQKYLLCIDDAGAASVVEGTQSSVSAAAVSWVNVSPAAKAFTQNPWAPIITVLSASRAILGVLTVATDATHTFIPGTTLLGATGITATFIDGIDPSLMPMMANDSGLLIGQSI